MADFNPVLSLTLKEESGFQKFASDTGNYVNGKLIGTNLGISAKAYYQFYKKVPSEQDMRSLTPEKARPIYKKNYWDKINGDKVQNQSVSSLMFLFIINSGGSQLSDLKDIANMVAGKKLFASVDTAFTDVETKILNSLPAEKYWNALKAWRHAFYLRLVAKVPKDKQFLNGWQKRLNRMVFVPNANDTNDTSGNTSTVFFLTLTALAIWKRKEIKVLASKLIH